MPASFDKPATRRSWLLLLGIALAAVVTGWPTLRGGFVGGDDRQLVMNHVLVNHPSWTHAARLFTIVHRDLYQPIPLLSFSAEFALANALGLFDGDVERGAWLFHLTNTLLHAVNAVLVWITIVIWSGQTDGETVSDAWRRDTKPGALVVATVAALIFAVHPLQIEVIAWVNGRMMLLSTAFALGTVASFGVWLRSGRRGWALLILLCTVLCGMSKVRVALPLLLVLLPLARGNWLRATAKRQGAVGRVDLREVLVLWALCTAVTGLLAAVNIYATAEAGMFEGAAETLRGPRAARVLMALAWYFQHYVWPSGLAAWYPTPAVIRWSDPLVLRSLVIAVPILVAVVWIARRSRVAAVGFAWFFLTIASTLPIIPSRQLLAADRYMYLPIVGLAWATGVILRRLYTTLKRRLPVGVLQGGAAVTSLTLAGALVGTSHHVASFYDTYLDKTLRIATLFPDEKYVWQRVAWSYFNRGRYQEAIETAKREFSHDDPQLHSEAYAIIGKAQMELGHPAEAILSLREAVKLQPEAGMPKYRLALVLEQAGDAGEALRLLEEAMTSLPRFNPGLVKLAEAYRGAKRPVDARRLYEKALGNNSYEVPAVLGLAELDIEYGTAESLAAAEQQLRSLLDWMPENATAWTNLGVIYAARGRSADATRAYRRALAADPHHTTAALNLGQLNLQAGDRASAHSLFDQAALRVESLRQTVDIHDFYIRESQPEKAVALWENYLRRVPEVAEAREFLALARVLSGDTAAALAIVDDAADRFDSSELALCTRTLAALAEGHYEAAMQNAEQLDATGTDGTRTRIRLLDGLRVFDERHPGVPWVYCLAAQVLAAEERHREAEVSIDLCEERCTDDACRAHVARLRDALMVASP